MSSRRYHVIDAINDGSLAALRRGLRIGVVVLTLLGCMAARRSSAAVIEGEISFPSPSMPSMMAYACEIDTSRRKAVSVAADQSKFSIDVPPGRYLVFLAPNEPGAPDIYGAFTQYSVCLAHASGGATAAPDSEAPSGECPDHALLPVNLTSRNAHVTVKIDDWYLSDDVAQQLDHLRGLEAAADLGSLGAPRFSEYPIAPGAASPAPKLELGGVDGSDEQRARLQQSLVGGPNFSAYLTAAVTPCGEACERLVLIDWHSGKVIEPAVPNAINEKLPCRSDEAVLFRRDSRLLSVTRAQGNGIVTDYYLWKPESEALVLATEYRRSERQFCAVLPP